MRKWQEAGADRIHVLTVAGGCLSAFLLPDPTGGDRLEGIVVNEIFYRGEASDLEYVELFNGSRRFVDVAALQISDSRRTPVPISSKSFLLPPDGYVVLTSDNEAFDARWSIRERIEVSSWPTLNNGGDTVILWDGNSVVDSVGYRPGWGGDDVALERIDPSGSSTSPTNWAESVDRSGGTPGRLNSVYTPDLRPPRPVFAEEREDGSIVITFSEPLAEASVSISAFGFESGARPRSVEFGDDQVTAVVWPPTGLLGGSVTVSGIADESGNVVAAAVVRISWLPGPGEIRVNEIMYEPLADAYDGLPDQTEYLEIISSTDRTLTLRPLVLTDHLDEHGRRDTTYLTDRRVSLQPGAIALVFAQPDPSVNQIGAAFPGFDPAADGLLVLPVRGASLSLGNTGDLVRLERASGILVDEVEYSPSWHLPEIGQTRGRSIERVSVSAASSDPHNWTSCVNPAGGTPGWSNSTALNAQTVSRRRLVEVAPSPFSPDGDGFDDAVSIRVNLNHPSAIVRAWIFDLGGREVTRLADARPMGPEAVILWNGRDTSDRLLRTGVYVVLVEAVNNSTGYVERGKAAVALVRN